MTLSLACRIIYSYQFDQLLSNINLHDNAALESLAFEIENDPANSSYAIDISGDEYVALRKFLENNDYSENLLVSEPAAAEYLTEVLGALDLCLIDASNAYVLLQLLQSYSISSRVPEVWFTLLTKINPGMVMVGILREGD